MCARRGGGRERRGGEREREERERERERERVLAVVTATPNNQMILLHFDSYYTFSYFPPLNFYGHQI